MSFNEINTDCFFLDDSINDSYHGNCLDFNEENQSNTIGEIRLWRAVLLQMFVDLKVKSNNKKYNFSKRKAYEWFKLPKNNEDLKEVCRLSGYEYRKVKMMADEIIEQNSENQNKNYTKI